jgi:4-diphosphocytidyl-2-C-methyl-D-erythritol kinase
MSDLTARYHAPAKLNLGLEITGRRPDGYHELVTIFQTIGLYDAVTIAPAAPGTLDLTADPTLGGDGNLILRAARALAEHATAPVGAALTLTKGIPVAAGLGGGSSDAAITLLALRERWRLPLDDTALARIAARLGADVPFFLRGGTVLATGIGERLSDLPALPESWFVTVTPRLDLPADKTRRLYAALTPADFGDGARTRAQADRLRAGLPLDPTLLVNSFTAPLGRLSPPLAAWRQRFVQAGAPFVLPSGSGPTLYTLVESAAAGQAICERLGGTEVRVALAPAIGQHMAQNTTRGLTTD